MRRGWGGGATLAAGRFVCFILVPSHFSSCTYDNFLAKKNTTRIIHIIYLKGHVKMCVCVVVDRWRYLRVGGSWRRMEPPPLQKKGRWRRRPEEKRWKKERTEEELGGLVGR